MADISIRQLTENDWAVLRALRLKALQANPSVFGSNYKKEASMTEDDWRGWLRKDDGAIFAILQDGVPIGMTGIAADRDDPAKKNAVLWGSWLEPETRGQGLSQIMYKARLDWARTHPTIERIIVSHRASNLSSKFANQKHGFVFTHTEHKIWPDGTADDNIFYALAVKPAPG